MKYHIYREQQLNCEIDAAWNFFASPGNLSRITPQEMKFKVVSELPVENIFPGMEINYTLSPLFGIPVKWTTRITQVDFQKSFTDLQDKGPYKYWNHHHEFVINKNGVLMKDTVDYELPFGILGRIVNALIVKRKLNDLFNYRSTVITKLFQQNEHVL
ncbi:MAG: hypothetical protein EOP53_17980 [Sphingobacteriales bacterium]|nr:MAG: hypothetical protein EOP53_17980 [Sphingobacteriales bacterium]